jgi:hypothetical protein
MFLYYIVRTLETYIRKYVGTNNKKYPNIKGLSENFTFFDGLTSFISFKIMSTLFLEYGYINDLYYLSLLK